jgi:hypothetical protein
MLHTNITIFNSTLLLFRCEMVTMSLNKLIVPSILNYTFHVNHCYNRYNNTFIVVVYIDK